MKFDFNSDKALYIQVYEQLEDAIFTGMYKEETQIPSTTEISTAYKINPATVLKGMNILVDENLIYKKRGLGMFVREGARDAVRKKRQSSFFDDYVKSLLTEAKKLGLSKQEITNLIERGY